jgi:6-phosphogluconolactonase (cycloisomerase 2 family)
MQMKFRALLSSVVMLITASLVGCGHYNCSGGAQFGNSTCTSSGSESLSGGSGGTTTAAFVYAVDTAGTIDSYTLNTTASTLVATTNYTSPIVPTTDQGSGMVVAQGKYLYVAFPSTFQIFGYSISASGGLTAISGSPFGAPFLSSAVYATESMITNPAGTLLFVTDLVSDQVYVYQIGSSGGLTAAAGSPFTLPFLPANMTTDGQGKYLYITEQFGTHIGLEIAAYSIGSSGTLTAVTGSPFSYPMWQLVGDPSGKYLIGTEGTTIPLDGVDDTHLYVFSIQQSGTNAGAIAPVSGSPFATVYSPFGIAMQSNSSGSLVYSFGINDTDTGYNPIEGFELNSSTGALTTASGSPFSGVSTGFWGQIDQSGQFLFVYGGVDNNGTVTTDFGALDIGSGGTLTQPTSQITFATPGVWAVTDPN